MPRFNQIVSAVVLSLAVVVTALSGCNFVQNPKEKEKQKEQDQITQKLKELKGAKDNEARVKAAYDLYDIPVNAERRDEVAQAATPLITDADPNVRLAGIRIAVRWGTKRHNEAALKTLIQSTDIREASESRTAIARLAP